MLVYAVRQIRYRSASQYCVRSQSKQWLFYMRLGMDAVELEQGDTEPLVAADDVGKIMLLRMYLL